MIHFFNEEECDNIINLVSNLEWEYCNENFEYYQTFFYEDWISSKILKILEKEKKISFLNYPITKVIKLKPTNCLPTHVQRFKNSDITFTTVCFLNDNFKGGNYYFNNHLTNIIKGFGVIHNLDSTQRIKEIEENDCYLLFAHFNTIIPNKLI
jgi:hypothetical protein